jgi:hypothetical protein
LGASTGRAAVCGYYIKSLRTGEQSAARQVAPHIADDAVARDGGSLQFHGPRQVSAWIRNPEGGLASAIPRNPKVAR